MKKEINSINDINLSLYNDVTRKNINILLSADLKENIDYRRAEFESYVEENRQKNLYGITTRQHVGAKHVLTDNELSEFGSRLPAYGSSMGTSLPERLTRGIIVARLADYINGTSGIRSKTVIKMLEMLESPLPKIPMKGNGEPGDIISLGALFQDVFSGQLKVGEGMALINGSPVATAALADTVLHYASYSSVIENVFSLAAVAIQASNDHYDLRLGELWNDIYIKKTLENINDNILDISEDKLYYQAPVSFRSAPRVFGYFRRVVEQAKELASISLQT